MPAWLLSPIVLKSVAILAAVLILLGMKHGYDESRRDEGRAEVQAKWDTDKAARLKAYTDMTTQWVTAQQDAEKNAAALAAERQGRINDAKLRALALPPADAGLRFPASARGVLNDAVRDSAATAGPAAEPAKPPADAAADTRVDIVTQWAVDVVGYYNACRDQVIGWQRFYAALRAAQPKVTP